MLLRRERPSRGKETVGEVFSQDSSDEVSSDEAEPGCARPSRKETVEVVKLVPREPVQQWTVEQIANWFREAWVQAGGRRSVYGQRHFSMR